MSDQKLLVEIGEISKVDNPSDKDMPEHSFKHPGHKMLYLPSDIADQIRQGAPKSGESESLNLFDEKFNNDLGIDENVPNNKPDVDKNKNAFPESSEMPKHFSFFDPEHKMQYVPNNIAEQIRQGDQKGGESEFENLFDENFNNDFRIDEIFPKNEPNADNNKNAFQEPSEMPKQSFFDPEHKMLYLPSNIAEQIRQGALKGGESEFENMFDKNFNNDFRINENVPKNETNADKNKNAFPESSDILGHSFIDGKREFENLFDENIEDDLKIDERLPNPIQTNEPNADKNKIASPESLNKGHQKSYNEENRENPDLNIIVCTSQREKIPKGQEMQKPVDTSSNLGEVVIHTNNGESQENIKPSHKEKYSGKGLWNLQTVFSAIVILVVLVATIGLICLFSRGKKMYTPRPKFDKPPSMSEEDFEIWVKQNITVARKRFPWNPYLWLPNLHFWK